MTKADLELHVMGIDVRVAALFGSVAGVLGVVTLIWHDWIETVFGVDPDAGSGVVEVLIVVVCFAASLGLFLLSWVGRRRPAATEESP